VKFNVRLCSQKIKCTMKKKLTSTKLSKFCPSLTSWKETSGLQRKGFVERVSLRLWVKDEVGGGINVLPMSLCPFGAFVLKLIRYANAAENMKLSWMEPIQDKQFVNVVWVYDSRSINRGNTIGLDVARDRQICASDRSRCAVWRSLDRPTIERSRWSII